MSDLRQCTRKFLKEFIEIYRENECLWNAKAIVYTNKAEKSKAYKTLCEKLLEVDENATVDTVKRKINSLRTNFRAEMKKVKNSIKTDNVYQSKLWYFRDLLFLTDQDVPRSGICSSNYSNSSLPDVTFDDSFQFNTSPSSVHENDSRQSTPFPRRKKLSNTTIEQAQNVVQDKLNARQVENDDECDIYGKHIACELRSLPEEDTIYVKKIINDAIFEAKVGRAKQISLIVNLDRNKNSRQPQ